MSPANHVLTTPALTADHNDLAVIGGGASAATLIIRLSQTLTGPGILTAPLRLHIFDPQGMGNGGLAYGRASPHHLLNSTRNEMSPWAPAEFHDWATNEKLGDHVTCFNRRADYHAYLRTRTDQAMDTLCRAGVDIRHHRHAVTITADTTPHAPNIYGISTQDDNRPLLTNLAAGQIVRCTGYGPGQSLADLAARYPDRIIDSLYTGTGRSALAGHPALKKDHPQIAIIGSGCGAYDAVCDLKGEGIEQASLTIVSPHAAPLQTRDLTVEAGESSITTGLLALDRQADEGTIYQALREDFAHAASPRRAALDILKSVSALGHDIARALTGSSAITCLRQMATPVPNESQTIMRHFNPAFIRSHITGTGQMLGDGQLRLDTATNNPIDADLVINCSGHGRCNGAATRALLNQGLAEIDTALNVLATDESGYRLRGSGLPTIGPDIHPGTDGVESFDLYAARFVSDFFADRLARLRPASAPRPAAAQPG